MGVRLVCDVVLATVLTLPLFSLTSARMRSEGYGSWVFVSVCLSVKSHITSGASVRPENTVTYSAGNGSRNICGDFSETAPLQRYTASCVVGLCSDISRTFRRQSLQVF